MWVSLLSRTGMLGYKVGCGVKPFVYLQLSGCPWIQRVSWPRTTWFLLAMGTEGKLLHPALSIEASFWGPFHDVVPV